MSSALALPAGLGLSRSPLKKPLGSTSNNCSTVSRCGSPIQPAVCTPVRPAACRAVSTNTKSIACNSTGLLAASTHSDALPHQSMTATAAVQGSPLQIVTSSRCKQHSNLTMRVRQQSRHSSSTCRRGLMLVCHSTNVGGSSAGPSGNDHKQSPRAASPMSTAEPYTAVAYQNPHQHPDDVALPMPAPATSAALPTVGLMSMSGPTADAAVAEANAAVTATTSVADLYEQQSAAAIAGLTVLAEVQQHFAMLQMQVSADQPAKQQIATLTAIVKHAAADQIPIALLTTPERLQLLRQLLQTDPAVAVLVAEVLCRVCCQDLEPYAQQLQPLVPHLLQVIKNNSTDSLSGSTSSTSGISSMHMPLLFFAVSTLVRMSSSRHIADAIVEAGGVPVLVHALSVAPPAVCQVTTFALFRLMRELDGDLTEEQLANWSSSSSSITNSSSSTSAVQYRPSRELLLMQIVRHGGFSKLCDVVAAVETGSAHELAFSMLLSLSLIPEMQKLVADRNEVRSIVQVLTRISKPSTRLEALLVLGRLAAHCVAVQQDAVREGAVPVLVDMMRHGSDEQRCHASRLLALLGQHPSTHQVIIKAGALHVAMRMIQDRGQKPPAAAAATTAVHAGSGTGMQLPQLTHDGKPLHIWQAAHATFHELVAAGVDGSKASVAAAVAAAAAATPVRLNVTIKAAVDTALHGGDSSSGGAIQQQHSIHTSTNTSSSGSTSESKHDGAAAAAAPVVGPSLVLEQAVGVVCMLTHNPDNHFSMVGNGIVPLLVSLMSKGTPAKTLTYALASLLMLSMAESRHAAVIARTGAVPMLITLVRESGNRPTIRELATALLAVMCRSEDVQLDVVAAGGIPALSRLLGEGTEAARCSACEALVQIAAPSDIRCRLVVRANAMQYLMTHMLQPGSSSTSLMWAARLIKVLMQERSGVREMVDTPRLIAILPELLSRKPSRQQQQSSSSSVVVGSSGSDGAPLPAVPALSGASLTSMDVDISGGNGRAAATAAAAERGDHDKAQAQLAWVVAALASHKLTRPIIGQMGSLLIRPLVVILRDSQRGYGSGYTLADVMDGFANSRQAASAAALRGMTKADDKLAALINAEFALQLWMGYRVELPKIAEDWPTAPNWYTPTDG